MPRSPIVFNTFLVALTACALVACSKPAEAPKEEAAAPPPPVAEAPPKPKDAVQFKVGELEAWAVRDGALEFPNDEKVFGFGRAPDEVNAVLAAANLPTDKLQLGLQPLLVKSGDKVLLFDTGAAGNFGPGNGLLMASLQEAGVEPTAVTDIFISHVHGDHVGGLVNASNALAFPNATIHIQKAEWKFLTTVPMDLAKQLGLAARDSLVAAMKPKVDAFAPGAELVKGVVKAVDVKGHTPGHSAYRITSGQDSLLYIGDSMHHSVISVQKPDWVMAFDADQKAGAASRVALVNELAKSGERVFAVHFPFPGIGKIEKRDDRFVWVAE